jgi:hypothetical protein
MPTTHSSGGQVVTLAAHGDQDWAAALAGERLVGSRTVVPDVEVWKEVFAAHLSLAFGAGVRLRESRGEEEGDGGEG